MEENRIGDLDTRKGLKGRPRLLRAKKKQISLMIRPNIHDDIRKILHISGDSLSSLMEKLLVDYIGTNKEKIEEYDEIMKE